MFNIKTFCKKSEGAHEMRPQLTGVHYAEGRACASDAVILAAVPAFYPETDEGKTIYKDGHEITGGKYPRVTDIFVRPEALEPVTISRDAVVRAAKEARATRRSRSNLGRCYIITANGTRVYYEISRMEKIAALMKYIKASKIFVDPIRPGYRAAYVYANDCNGANGWGVVMPTNTDDDPDAVAIC